MPKLIIGLVGQQGCGKGTASKILQEKYGAELFRFSAILNDILGRLSLPQDRNHFIKLSEALRAAFGEDVLAYAIERDAVNSKADVIVIDGIRRPEDIVALEPLPQFKLIEIAAKPEIRFERMKERGEKSGESQRTYEDFLAEEQRSTEVTIPLVAKRAWKILDNDGTLTELEERLEAVMQELQNI